MTYYANDQERARLIAGLRDLADFLDQNPQVPAPRYTDLFVFPPGGERRGDVRGSRRHRRADRHHGQRRTTARPAITARSRYFGPVQYRAVAIPQQRTQRRNEEAE